MTMPTISKFLKPWLRNFCQQNLKSTIDKKGNRKSIIDLSQIETIINPTDPKYIQAFMEAHGKYRPDFQTDEIEQRRKAFRDKFSFAFLCKKGTTEIIYSIQIVKCASLKDRNNDFSFLGLGWIPEKYRGSKELWTGPIAEIKRVIVGSKDKNMIGCAIPKMVKVYFQFSNLKKMDKVLNYYSSICDKKHVVIPDLKFSDDVVLKDKNEVDFNDVIKYDQSIFPYERSKYIEMLFDHPDNYSKIALDKNGKIIGFGVVVVNPSGECVINPLYADNKQIAQSIFQSILKKMPLNSPKFTHFKIRSNDRCKFSFDCFTPFFSKPLEQELLFELVYTVSMPTDFDFSKVVTNTHPTTCPI